MNRLSKAGLALGIGAVATFLVVRARRRVGWSESAERTYFPGTQSFSLDPAKVIVVRASRAIISLDASEHARIEVSSLGAKTLEDILTVARDDAGSQLILDVVPRQTMKIRVPAHCALRVEAARSCIRVHGLDEVAVSCTRSTAALHDVAGAVAIDLVRAAVKVDLSRSRRTSSVDLSARRGVVRLDLPADPGGAYHVREERSSVVHPASVENGVRVAVQADRASVAIRAA